MKQATIKLDEKSIGMISEVMDLLGISNRHDAVRRSIRLTSLVLRYGKLPAAERARTPLGEFIATAGGA